MESEGGTNKLAPKLFISFISIFPFYTLNIAHFFFTLRDRLKINKSAKIIIQA